MCSSMNVPVIDPEGTSCMDKIAVHMCYDASTESFDADSPICYGGGDFEKGRQPPERWMDRSLICALVDSVTRWVSERIAAETEIC